MNKFLPFVTVRSGSLVSHLDTVYIQLIGRYKCNTAISKGEIVMEMLLLLLSGICWTVVYLELVRTGFKEKTYGMPLFALALNVTWEGLYTFKDLAASTIPVQGWVNLVWVLFDIAIVTTYFRYGRKDFEKFGLLKHHFIPWSILIFATSFVLQYSFLVEFGDNAPKYSAFLQNLIMSVLFICMLVARKSTLGQNQVIAVCKWLGTVAPTISIGVMHGNKLVLVLGIFCSVFDLIYIYALRLYSKAAVEQPEAFMHSGNGDRAVPF
jgi:hypothetical protein